MQPGPSGHPPASPPPAADLHELLREINELKAGLLVDSVTHDNPTFEGPPWAHEHGMESGDRLRLDLPGDLDDSLEEMVAKDASLQYILSPQAEAQVVRAGLPLGETEDSESPQRPMPSPYVPESYRTGGVSPGSLSTSSGTPYTPADAGVSRPTGYDPYMTRDMAYMSANSSRLTPGTTPDGAYMTPASVMPAATPASAGHVATALTYTTPSPSASGLAPGGRVPVPAPTPQPAGTARRTVGSRIARPGGIPGAPAASTSVSTPAATATPSASARAAAGAGASTSAAPLSSRSGAVHGHSHGHTHQSHLSTSQGLATPTHAHATPGGGGGAARPGTSATPPQQPPRSTRAKLTTAVGAATAASTISRAGASSSVSTSSRIPSSRNASSTGPTPTNSVGPLRSGSCIVSASLVANTPPAGSTRKRPSASGPESHAATSARRPPSLTMGTASHGSGHHHSHQTPTTPKVPRTPTGTTPGSGSRVPGRTGVSGSGPSHSRVASPATSAAAAASPVAHRPPVAPAVSTPTRSTSAPSPPPAAAVPATTAAVGATVAAASAAQAIPSPDSLDMECEASHRSLTLPSWGGADALAAESLESLLAADPALNMSWMAATQRAESGSEAGAGDPRVVGTRGDGGESGVLKRRTSDELLRPLEVAIADGQGQEDWMEEDADAEMSLLLAGEAAASGPAVAALVAARSGGGGTPAPTGVGAGSLIEEEGMGETTPRPAIPGPEGSESAMEGTAGVLDPPPGSTVCKVRELLGLDDPGNPETHGEDGTEYGAGRQLNSEELWRNITLEANNIATAAATAGAQIPAQADSPQQSPQAQHLGTPGTATAASTAPFSAAAAAITSQTSSPAAGQEGLQQPQLQADPSAVEVAAADALLSSHQRALSAVLSRAMSMQRGPPAHEVLLSGDDESELLEHSGHTPVALGVALLGGEDEAGAASSRGREAYSHGLGDEHFDGMDTDADGTTLELLAAEAAAAAAVVVAGGTPPPAGAGPRDGSGTTAEGMEVDDGYAAVEPEAHGRRLLHQSSSASSFGFSAAVASEAAAVSRQLTGDVPGERVIQEEGGSEAGSPESDGLLHADVAGEALLLACRLERGGNGGDSEVPAAAMTTAAAETGEDVGFGSDEGEELSASYAALAAEAAAAAAVLESTVSPRAAPAAAPTAAEATDELSELPQRGPAPASLSSGAEAVARASPDVLPAEVVDQKMDLSAEMPTTSTTAPSPRSESVSTQAVVPGSVAVVSPVAVKAPVPSKDTSSGGRSSDDCHPGEAEVELGGAASRQAEVGLGPEAPLADPPQDAERHDARSEDGERLDGGSEDSGSGVVPGDSVTSEEAAMDVAPLPAGAVEDAAASGRDESLEDAARFEPGVPAAAGAAAAAAASPTASPVAAAKESEAVSNAAAVGCPGVLPVADPDDEVPEEPAVASPPAAANATSERVLSPEGSVGSDMHVDAAVVEPTLAAVVDDGANGPAVEEMALDAGADADAPEMEIDSASAGDLSLAAGAADLKGLDTDAPALAPALAAATAAAAGVPPEGNGGEVPGDASMGVAESGAAAQEAADSLPAADSSESPASTEVGAADVEMEEAGPGTIEPEEPLHSGPVTVANAAPAAVLVPAAAEALESGEEVEGVNEQPSIAAAVGATALVVDPKASDPVTLDGSAVGSSAEGLVAAVQRSSSRASSSVFTGAVAAAVIAAGFGDDGSDNGVSAADRPESEAQGMRRDESAPGVGPAAIDGSLSVDVEEFAVVVSPGGAQPVPVPADADVEATPDAVAGAGQPTSPGAAAIATAAVLVAGTPDGDSTLAGVSGDELAPSADPSLAAVMAAPEAGLEGLAEGHSDEALCDADMTATGAAESEPAEGAADSCDASAVVPATAEELLATVPTTEQDLPGAVSAMAEELPSAVPVMAEDLPAAVPATDRGLSAVAGPAAETGEKRASDAATSDEQMFDAEEDGFEVGMAAEDLASHGTPADVAVPGAAAAAASAAPQITPFAAAAEAEAETVVCPQPAARSDVAIDDGAGAGLGAAEEEDIEDELPRKAPAGAGPAVVAAAAAASAAAAAAAQAKPSPHQVKYARLVSPRNDESAATSGAVMDAAGSEEDTSLNHGGESAVVNTELKQGAEEGSVSGDGEGGSEDTAEPDHVRTPRGGGPVAEGVETGAGDTVEAAASPGVSPGGSASGGAAAAALAAAAGAAAATTTMSPSASGGVTVPLGSSRLGSDASQASSAFASVQAMAAVARDTGHGLGREQESFHSGLQPLNPESLPSDTFSLVFSEMGSRLVSSTGATSWATPSMSRQPTVMGRPGPVDTVGSFSDSSSGTAGRAVAASAAAAVIAAGVAQAAGPAAPQGASAVAPNSGAEVAPEEATAPEAPAESPTAPEAEAPAGLAEACAAGAVADEDTDDMVAADLAVASQPQDEAAAAGPETSTTESQPSQLQEPSCASPPVPITAPPPPVTDPSSSSPASLAKPAARAPAESDAAADPPLLHAWQVLASPTSPAGGHPDGGEGSSPAPRGVLLGSRSSMRSMLGGSSRLSRVSSRKEEEDQDAETQPEPASPSGIVVAVAAAGAVAALGAASDPIAEAAVEGADTAMEDAIGAAADEASGASGPAEVPVSGVRVEGSGGGEFCAASPEAVAFNPQAPAAAADVDMGDAAVGTDTSPFGAVEAVAAATGIAGVTASAVRPACSGPTAGTEEGGEQLVPAWKVIQPAGSPAAAGAPTSAAASLGCRRSLRSIQLAPSGSRLKRTISQTSLDVSSSDADTPRHAEAEPPATMPARFRSEAWGTASPTAPALASAAAVADAAVPDTARYDSSDDEDASLQPAWKVMGQSRSGSVTDSPDAVAAARNAPLGAQPSFRSARSGHSRLRRATAPDGDDPELAEVVAAAAAAVAATAAAAAAVANAGSSETGGVERAVDAAATTSMAEDAGADGVALDLASAPPVRTRSRTMPGNPPAPDSLSPSAAGLARAVDVLQLQGGYSSDGHSPSKPPALQRGGSGGRLRSMGTSPQYSLNRSGTLDSGSGLSRLAHSATSENGAMGQLCASRFSSRRIIPDSIGTMPLPRRSSGGGDPNVDAMRPAWQVLPMVLVSPTHLTPSSSMTGTTPPAAALTGGGSSAGAPSAANMLASMRSSSRLSRMSSGIPDEVLAELKLQAQAAVGHLQGNPHGDDSGGGLADMTSSVEESAAYERLPAAGSVPAPVVPPSGDGAGGIVHAWKVLPMRAAPPVSGAASDTGSGGAAAAAPPPQRMPMPMAMAGRPTLGATRGMNPSSRLAVASSKAPQVTFEPSSPSVRTVEEDDETSDEQQSEEEEEVKTAAMSVAAAASPPAQPAADAEDDRLVHAWKLVSPTPPAAASPAAADAAAAARPARSTPPANTPPALLTLGSRRSLKSMNSAVGGSRLSRASLAPEDYVDDSYSVAQDLANETATPEAPGPDLIATADDANQDAVAAAVAAAAIADDDDMEPEPQSERSSAPAGIGGGSGRGSGASERGSASSGAGGRPQLVRGNTTGSIKLPAEDSGEGAAAGAGGSVVAGAVGLASQRSSRSSSSGRSSISRSTSSRSREGGASGAPWELGEIREEGDDEVEEPAAAPEGEGRSGLQGLVVPSGSEDGGSPLASGRAGSGGGAAVSWEHAAAESAASRLSPNSARRASARSNSAGSSRLSRVTSQISESGLEDIVEEGAEVGAEDVVDGAPSAVGDASGDSGLVAGGSSGVVIWERASSGRAPPPAPSAGKARIGSPVAMRPPSLSGSPQPHVGSRSPGSSASGSTPADDGAPLLPAWKVLVAPSSPSVDSRPEADTPERTSPAGPPGAARHPGLRSQRSGNLNVGSSRLSRMTSGVDTEQDEKPAGADATGEEDAEKAAVAPQAELEPVADDAAAPEPASTDSAEKAAVGDQMAPIAHSAAAVGSGSGSTPSASGDVGQPSGPHPAAIGAGAASPASAAAVGLESNATTADLSNLTLANLPSARFERGSALSAGGVAMRTGSDTFSSFTAPAAADAAPAGPSLLAPGSVIKEEEAMPSPRTPQPKCQPSSAVPATGANTAAVDTEGSPASAAAAGAASAEPTSAGAEAAGSPAAAPAEAGVSASGEERGAPPQQAPQAVKKPQPARRSRGFFACFACFGGGAGGGADGDAE